MGYEDSSMTNDELKRLQAECKHDGIKTWRFADSKGEPAGMWSCSQCGHKFVPLDLDMERDAKRYRWLRDTGHANDTAIDENMP